MKNDFVEVQGASFSSMTAYGRNITVKNIIMSSEKFNEINSAKYSGNYAKHDEKFNEEYKLSKFTLENYFDLKQNIPEIDPKHTSPGIINIAAKQPEDIRQIRYSLTETPSSYKFKFDKERKNGVKDDGRFFKNPSLGVLKEYKDTMDGFKNLGVTINDKKILEVESIHNWQKIMHYVRTRDMQFLNGLKTDGKGEITGRIEVHHINQLQDDGKENVRNLIALSEDKHRLADTYRVLMDKNTGYYREKYFENTSEAERINIKTGKDENGGGNLIIYNNEVMRKLLANISKLDLNDKIMLNDIKLDVESNSAMRLAMLTDTAEHLKLLFIDRKTGEELRMLAAKTDDETEKYVSKTALVNFIGNLATSSITR